MNEYQDQVTWFRLEIRSGPGCQPWAMLSDHDTQEEADTAKAEFESIPNLVAVRVRRMSGLPEGS